MTASIEFWVRYNWPTGKISISSIHLSPFNSNYKIRLLAESNEELGKRYTFNELVEGKFSVENVSRVLSEGATKGQYLTGDIFYIEVFNDKGFVKGMKLDAKAKKPSRASGPTHVETQYFFDI